MKIIAHRGASGEFPENSLLAFEQAIKQKADAIELDIHFHQASGEFIVIHDAYVDKTTNAQGHINQHSFNELQQLSLGKQQRIVTLAQALAIIDGKIDVNIEVKVSASSSALSMICQTLHTQLSNAVESNNFTVQQLIISSFNHQILLLCKQQMPQFTTAALIGHSPLDLALFTSKLNCRYLNIDIDSISTELITDAHQRGLIVWVYTVDRLEDIKHCFAHKIDGIFTNYPLRSRKFLNNKVTGQISSKASTYK
jgi:glycerophosphoryl diester phosphodiesterase